MQRKVNKVNQSSTQLSSDEVFDAIHALMHLYRAQQYQVVRQAGHGLTHLEGKVLGFFARHPGALAGELAARSGRDKAQVARMLATLKSQGLIDAQADPADRRRQAIHLTPAGQALHDALQREMRHVAKRSLEGLSDSERLQLLALLQRVRANLEPAEQVPTSG